MGNTFKHQKTYDLDKDDYPYHTNREEKKKNKLLARAKRKHEKQLEHDEKYEDAGGGPGDYNYRND